MTAPAQRRMSKEDLRAALPDVAHFVDTLRAVFGPGVRVEGIRTPEFAIGRPDVVPGIRLSECVWDAPAKPVAAPARRRRA